MDAFLTEAEVAEINAIREQAFNTRMLLQNPRRTIVLDRNGAAVPAQEVVIEWANLQPERAGMGPTGVQGHVGMMQRWGSLDALPGGCGSRGGALRPRHPAGGLAEDRGRETEVDHHPYRSGSGDRGEPHPRELTMPWCWHQH